MEETNDGAKIEYLKALNKVQGLLEPVTKDKTNPHFKSEYASLSAVNDTIMGPLAENGFVLLSGGVEIGGKPWLRTTLLHVSGHSMSFDYPLLVNDDNPQHLASATSYARRYSLCAFFNLSTEDDDGNAAAAPAVRQAASRPSPSLAPARTPEASGFEVARFVPSRVDFVEGKGKGAGKTFCEIYRADGTKFSGNEIQGEIAESARTGKKEVIVAFEKRGNYFNIKRDGVKMADSQPDPEPIIDDVGF